MKVFVDTIGCRLNQSEIEKIAGQFRTAGHQIIDTPAEADLVVVNTCAVTAAAASDSRQKIRQAARAGAQEIVVTGCWSTLDAKNALLLPGVSRVIPNSEKETLVSQILGVSPQDFDLEPLAREPLPGVHLRTRAFIKVQDGCNNHCTFCVTRIARGAGVSQKLEDVLADIHSAVEGGAKEVVLSGVHLGSWGQDWENGTHLKDLIRTILNETDIERLRLSSLEPWDLDKEFFKLWENPRMCRHLHLPLQSGCAATLKRMVRNTTPQEFERLVGLARSIAPDMGITTDIIVGFPGETSEEFAESLDFIQKMAFSGGHVFTYSARPGTPAVKLNNLIRTSIGRERNHLVQSVLTQSALQYQRQFVGQTVPVLWESTTDLGPDGWRIHGLTGTYIKVDSYSKTQLWNQISQVKLLEKSENGLTGLIIA